MAESKPMTGKTVLITGGTDGIGKEAAKQLARMGAEVVIVGRNPDKTKKALAEIQLESGSSQASYLMADLASLDQVRGLAAYFRSAHKRLDVLVNNAGSAYLSRQLSEDGYEKTFAVNHLSHFLLTDLLLDLLKASTPSRIVITSSGSHRNGKIRFEDIHLQKRYFIIRLLQPLIMGRGLPVEKGAQTLVYLASSPDVEGISGKYFYKKEAVQTLAASYDQKAQQRLWALSAEMVGI